MQNVVESYAAELEEERKRAEIAEEFIESMGEIGLFLRSLPKEVWKNFWDLMKTLPKFMPWVKEKGGELERQWRAEQEEKEEKEDGLRPGT